MASSPRFWAMASRRTSLPEGPGLDILEGSKGVPHQFFGCARVAIQVYVFKNVIVCGQISLLVGSWQIFVRDGEYGSRKR